MSDSRVPGFYKLNLARRRSLVSELCDIELEEIVTACDRGGIDPDTADKIVENVLGTYALPYGLALNARVNQVDRLIPMVVEEPSVIAAASNAARMVRAGGGFTAMQLDSLMIGQVEIFGVEDSRAAVLALERARAELLRLAEAAAPGLLPYGGGPRDLQVRDLGQGMVVLHVLVDCRDAMGANMVNTVAEALGPRVAELAKGRLGLRILSNLADRRRVEARCRVPAEALTGDHSEGSMARGLELCRAIEQASRFAEADPYRAATHNKGIMNGVDAVVMATGNDWRAVEAGAHAYAARSGRYEPLSRWRCDGEHLVGHLELPLALGTVGGTLRVHPGARLALKLAGVTSAADLALLAACAGLASNLAALRALASEGIQRGHMGLHARSVAVTVGALGGEVDLVATRLVEGGTITEEAARAELAKLRSP